MAAAERGRPGASVFSGGAAHSAFKAAILAWVDARETDPKDIRLVLGRSLDAFLAKGVAGKLGRYEATGGGSCRCLLI
jgi:hypothetical protein